MRLQELLRVADFPAVVAGSDIAALRQTPNSPGVNDFLNGYLGFDARSQHALHTTLSSLAQPQGGAFWLNGVFGSGKSHLLGVLTLLAEGQGHEAFAASHPDCAPYLERFAPRLAIHISLDEFDAAKLGLEEIFWREAAREWARHGFRPWKIERSGARVEAFAALESAVKSQAFSGIVVCFDELSLFLGGRDHSQLQGDAAFLQFLGGQSRRAPLWVFAALQKTIDDISGLERYSLAQIRDRFVTLPLSLANVPALVQKRLVRVLDELEVTGLCLDTFARLSQRHPRLDFGPQEWRAAWPFHPATLSLLEAVTGRFFSRTRSAAIFCARAIDLQKQVTYRVPPDAIWDYFQPELETHPDLRPLENVWRSWEESLVHLFSDNDRENGRRVMKVLLLCKIAGQSPTPVQIANALNFELDMSGDGAYEYARFLLERLRSRGAFLAVERGETSLFDRYTVDLGRRVGEMARRQIGATLETLPPGDGRIAAHALNCCRGEPLPLSELGTPRSFAIFWHSAQRQLSVEVWDGLAPHLLANRAATTRETGAPDDAVLAILPPFGAQEYDLDALFGGLEPEARRALWIWKPRPPARDELDLARESTAALLATRDPGLGDNRRGRALLEHLQKEAPARDAQVARVALRLLLEGEVVLGGGVVLEACELARGDGFAAWLESVGDFAWPHLFPNFPSIAPRARLLTASNGDTLCLEILRRPMEEPYFAPSLERLARHIGEPLGVAKSHGGRWKIAAGQPELVAFMRDFLGEGTTLAALEAYLAKSEWGVTASQTAIMVCALLRSGELAAFDGRGVELSPPQIGFPLRRAVHYLRPGRLPENAEWTRIAVLTQELEGQSLGAPSFTEAQLAATLLLRWRENAAQSADLARARAAQLRRSLGHPPEAWAGFETAGQALGVLLETIPQRGATFEVLSRAATLDFTPLREPIALFRRYESALESRLTPLLALHALLTHPELVVPTELAPQRAVLLERLHGGEAILFDPDIITEAETFTSAYTEKYALWHSAQNDSARWNAWRRLSQSEATRTLERLSTLQNRAFGATLREEIETEMAKHCPRDGTLSGGEAVCSSCGLRLGERLVLRDPREIETAMERELESLRRALQETAPRSVLQREASPLLEWDGEVESLLPLLSSAHLRVLDRAFAPRRQVPRSGAQLMESLSGCRTRHEIEAAFAAWLDGGEGLSSDDEIEWLP